MEAIMKTLLAIIGIIFLVGCAPLNPHNTIGEDVGEVALRVVACPVTLCLSEYMMHEERRIDAMKEAAALKKKKDQEEYQKQYWAWYDQLSEEQKNIEDLK